MSYDDERRERARRWAFIEHEWKPFEKMWRIIGSVEGTRHMLLTLINPTASEADRRDAAQALAILIVTPTMAIETLAESGNAQSIVHRSNFR